MSDATTGTSRRRSTIKRSQLEVRPLTQTAIESKKRARGRQEDGDVDMNAAQSAASDEDGNDDNVDDVEDVLGDEEGEESDDDAALFRGYEEQSDSEDEYRPEPANKGGAQKRRSSSRRDGSAGKDDYETSSGEEFENSDAGWESEGMGPGPSANQFDASQQAPTTDSQRVDRARKNKWKPPRVRHGGLEGLATWKQIGSLQRSKRAAAAAANEDDDADVEVEDGEIRTLADAFANVGSSGDAMPGAQIQEWQRALHADDDADDEMDETAFENDVRAAAGFRRKKAPRGADGASLSKRRRAPREQALSPEVRQLVAKANLAYVHADLTTAVETLQEVIRIEPAVRTAWATLAVCFGEMEQTERALQCQIMAAHLTSHPLQLWLQLAEQSKELNYNEQALYCLSKAISASEDKDRSDVLDIMWERGQMLHDLGNDRRAIKNFLRMLHYRPQNQELIRQVVPMLDGLQMYAKAVEVLEQCAEWNMQAFPDPLVDPAWLDKDVHPDVHNTYEPSEIVTLADLLLKLDRPHEALNALRKGARWLQGRGSETFWDDIQSDDREFDLERSSKRPGDYGRRVNLAPVYDLEVEFRFRIAKARARMDNVLEARRQFKIWKDSVDPMDKPVQMGEMIDEYVRMASRIVGDEDATGNEDDNEDDDDDDNDDEGQDDDDRTSMRKELYTDARDLALYLIDGKPHHEAYDDEEAYTQNEELVRNYSRMAQSCMGLGEYEDAKRYLSEVIEYNPDDLESKMLMAEVLEAMDQTKEAMALVTEVMQAKRTQSAHDGDLGDPMRDVGGEALPQSLSLFVELTERGGGGGGGSSLSASIRAARKGSRDQLMQLEALRESEALATRQKVKALEEKVFVDRWWHPDVPMAGDATQRIYGSRETPEERRARFKHVSEWLADMEGLVTTFCNTGQLFLKDKTKRFSGMFRRTRRRGGGDAIDRQARAMLSRMQDAFMDEGQIMRNVEHSMFRGVPLNEWVDMVMQYAFVLTKTGDFASAREVIHRVMRSNVVWSDDERRLSLSMCLASCAIYTGRYSTAMSEAGLRSLAFTYQFHPEILRVLLVIGNASGQQANRALGSTNNLKFFLRRSRIHEALVQDAKSAFSLSKSRWVVRDRMFENSAMPDEDEEDEEEELPTQVEESDMEGSEEDDGASTTAETTKARSKKGALAFKRKLATETGTARNIWSEISHLSTIDHVKAKPPTKYNPANDMFYAGLLLTSSNGTPSMAYWLRIYARQPNDAMVCLACAVACLGRSANRQVDNRHQVVTQAYAMMHFYRAIRRQERRRQRVLQSGGVDDDRDDEDEDDEAEVHYNFGRAAQHLGLYQLAVPHYRAVLERHDNDKASSTTSSSSPPASSFDCVAEAAFCLHLIYIASGNPRLANAVMERYLRV